MVLEWAEKNLEQYSFVSRDEIVEEVLMHEDDEDDLLAMETMDDGSAMRHLDEDYLLAMETDDRLAQRELDEAYLI